MKTATEDKGPCEWTVSDVRHALRSALRSHWDISREAQFMVALHKKKQRSLQALLDDLTIPLHTLRYWETNAAGDDAAERAILVLVDRRKQIATEARRLWASWVDTPTDGA